MSNTVARSNMAAATPERHSLTSSGDSPLVLRGSDALDDTAAALAERVGADIRATFTQAVREEAKRLAQEQQQGGAVHEGEPERRVLFHEKQFKVRESVLSQMLASGPDDSYRSIYHALLAALIWLGVKLMLSDYHSRGVLVDFNLLAWAFDKTDVVMRTWVTMQVVAMISIPLVQWIKAHPTDGRVLKQAIIIHFTVIVLLYVYASWVCLSAQLPPSSGLIVMCEVARLSMKMHAYAREKTVHGLRYVLTPRDAAPAQAAAGTGGQEESSAPAPVSAKAVKNGTGKLARNGSSSEAAAGAPAPTGASAASGRPPKLTLQQSLQAFADYLPPEALREGITIETVRAAQPHITIGSLNDEIGRYVYFLFAPTIVYRDEYPRNERPIDWVQAGVHVANLAAVVLYTYVIIRGILTPLLATAPPRHPIDLVLLVQSIMLPCMLVFLISFFGILHTWLNLFAELLRFGDRQFYHRWWSATSWSAYYRRWNLVVGDWLHAYLYQDLQRLGMAKPTAEAGVFILSAIVHELILACAFRFWMPALLVLFGGPGVWFMRLTRKFAKRFANVFMWAMLSIGLAMLFMMYTRELYARYGYMWVDETSDPGQYYKYDPTMHPSPEWTLADYASYILLPRSWIEYYRLWIVPPPAA